MIHMQRKGIVLAPQEAEFRTRAMFNAGMVRDGDIVHMLYRCAEWRPDFDPRSQSNYAVEALRFARLAPDSALLYDSHQVQT